MQLLPLHTERATVTHCDYLAVLSVCVGPTVSGIAAERAVSLDPTGAGSRVQGVCGNSCYA